VLGLLRNQKCLWNVKLKNYRNGKVRDKALKELVKELNTPDFNSRGCETKNQVNS
jgi:hypothetical protein